MQPTDAGFAYLLATDPDVRRWSLDPTIPEWPSHLRYFARLLRDPNALGYVVGTPEGIPIGLVRFSRPPVMISIAVAPNFRGKGLASRILDMASATCERTWGQDILAVIKWGNEASYRAFSKAGYILDGVSEGYFTLCRPCRTPAASGSPALRVLP